MSTKKRTGKQEGFSSNEDRQLNSQYGRGYDRYAEDRRWRGNADDFRGNYPQYYERGQYTGRGDRENRSEKYQDTYNYPARNDDWRQEEDRWEQQNQDRHSSYYPGGVQGNRNESRGEGYRGYGRQGEGGSYRPGERYDDDDQFYRDRGYSRDMYARNDRYYRPDHNDRSYRQENYRRDDRYDDRFEDDRMMDRDDYNKMYRGGDQSFAGGSRSEGAYGHGSRSGYGYDIMPDRENLQQRPYRETQRQSPDRENQQQGNERESQQHRNEGPQHRRVVGRGMYGNNPSGRYGNYGGDMMHGNMGGGDWHGNNEYQVGGGTGYQPSDAGTYGSYSTTVETWDEDRPPGRKIAAKNNPRGSSKSGDKNKNINLKKGSNNLSAAKKNGGSMKTATKTNTKQNSTVSRNKKENKNPGY